MLSFSTLTCGSPRKPAVRGSVWSSTGCRTWGDRVPEAAEWFRRGWENGRNLDCEIELGKLLVAEHWYEIAAGAGHPAAQRSCSTR
jgi:hypothetical protein